MAVTGILFSFEFRGGKGVAVGDVGEAHERVHQGELPRVVELEAGDALARRRDRRLREPAQLAAIDEGLQNVLLYVQVVVIDRGEGIAENRRIFILRHQCHSRDSRLQYTKPSAISASPIRSPPRREE